MQEVLMSGGECMGYGGCTHAAAAQHKHGALAVGQKAPDFAVAFASEDEITSDSIKGKHKVIYFYPKDDTPGCTIEAKDFRDYIKAFEAAGAVVIGVSKDSTKSHDAF